MITGMRVRNLRAIADSGQIRLAKINVLVGKNSAGKSTLLRILPLLRQSVERPTKGPLLWYGRFVDFGDFQNAVNANAKEKGVSLDFSMSLAGDSRRSRHLEDGGFFNDIRQARFYHNIARARVTLALGRGVDDEIGQARSIMLDLGTDRIELKFDDIGDPELHLNGVNIDMPPAREWIAQPGKILPIPTLVRRRTDGSPPRTILTFDQETLFDRLVSSMRPLFHGNTSEQKISDVARALKYANETKFHEQLREFSGAAPSFAHYVGQMPPKHPALAEIRQNVLLNSVTAIFRRVDGELSDLAQSVRYVEPIRATAERYYRQQDLAVDEIDSRGENAAMFLSSLSHFESGLLEDWMKKNLGFFAYTEQGSGHVQVKIGEVDRQSGGKNIADLGFGYSQLLPIILQLWRSMVRPDRRALSRSNAVLAIEQPELHLHPQFQAQIADIITAAVKAAPEESQSHIFIETHSEHIVNRLGQLVASGRLAKEDVQMLVVEPSGDRSIRVVAFDSNGFLDTNWPVGFFVPELGE